MIEKFRDLENEIVFIKDEEVFTDSKIIAHEFNRRHDNILQLIDECVKDVEVLPEKHNLRFKVMKTKINVGNNARRDSKTYSLNRDAFMFLVMRMKGRKSDIYKIRFINAFNLMEQWLKDRAVGRGVRLSMTDSIKNYIPDSPNKKFKYKHFTDLVYKKVLGKSKKQIESELGEGIETLRDICTNEQLKAFETYENEISVLLKYGKTYSEIKEILK